MIALNFGWSAAMNRIQTKTNLFRSFSPDARYLIGVSVGRDSVALLNLLRGAGITGLAAMREVSTRRMDDLALAIVRPLLSVWRSEIDKYVREHHLKFREDASNKNLNPLRNRVRHRVIPYLEKMLGRNIRQNIWRTAVIAAEEENWIENQLPDSDEVELPVAKLRDTPVALQRRRILKWLRAQSVSDVGFDLIERVRSLAERDARIAKVNLPQDRP